MDEDKVRLVFRSLEYIGKFRERARNLRSLSVLSTSLKDDTEEQEIEASRLRWDLNDIASHISPGFMIRQLGFWGEANRLDGIAESIEICVKNLNELHETLVDLILQLDRVGEV